MAACLASKGFKVVGVDVDPRAVDLVNQGRAPIQEPALEALIQSHRQNLEATASVKSAVEQSETTFIVVPTPSEADGRFSTTSVRQAAREIGQALAQKHDYHLVVLASTVLPGGTEEGVVKVLEQESGKRCSEEFGVCYNPEFVALGSVIHDMLNPDVVLIGESDPGAGGMLERLYGEFLESCPVFVRSNFANAELAKIAVNAFVTMKISFANILSELCEHIPSGDVDIVTKAVGSDSRIGPRYLKGGLGFGGPCFPRDTVAFSAFAQALGVSAGLTDAVGRYNRSIPSRVAKMAQEHLPPNGVGFVVGLAYKPNTPVVEDSQGLEIARTLTGEGARVRVYDPLALDAARKRLSDSVRYVATLAEGMESADVVVLANPLPELRELPGIIAGSHSKPVVVIDCWRAVPELAHTKGVRYLALGSSACGAEEHVAAQ